MNLGAIISAVPWLRRVWKLMPAPLRIPVLLVAAAVGVWYALTGRRQLLEQDRGADAELGEGAGGDGREDDHGPAGGGDDAPRGGGPR